MTYRELINLLSKMDEETLDMNVTIHFEDEYYPAKVSFADDNQSVLDIGHPVILVQEYTF